MNRDKVRDDKGSTRSDKRKLRSIIAATLLPVALIALIVYWFTHNDAQDALQPVESELIKEGAAKVCSRGDNGLGPDNQSPWYYAIYQIADDRQHATELVQRTAAKSGFTLARDYPPVNAEDNLFYADRTSKKSGYLGLKPGNAELTVEILGSSVPTDKGGNFCTVQKSSNPPPNKTTISINIGLPSR